MRKQMEGGDKNTASNPKTIDMWDPFLIRNLENLEGGE
jgi:hypothetical protein